MSIVSLLPCDQRRSGCSFTYLQAPTSPNGNYFHPFRWHDSYWRPHSLPDQLERDCITAHESYVDAIQFQITKPKEDLVVVFEGYFRLLSQAEKVVSSDPPQDYADAYLGQVNRCRIECLYNIGLSFFIGGLQDHAQYSRGVQQLQEAAGIFNFLLTVEFKVESERIEVSPDNLRVMAALSMASAHEMVYAFHYKDSFFNVTENAALAHRASFYYTAVVAIASATVAIPDRSALLNLGHIKRNFYDGAMLFLMSLEPNTTKGESRRRRACTSFDAALQNVLRALPGERPNVEKEIQIFIDRCTNYRRQRRRNQIPEASFVTVAKRSPTIAQERYPRVLISCLPDTFSSLFTPSSLTVEDECESRPLSTVKVETFVENHDLRTRRNHVSSASNSARYHLVQALVRLSCPKEERPALSQAALILVVDVNLPNEKQRQIFLDLIGLALRAGRFTEADKVGIVCFDDNGCGGSVELHSAGESNIGLIAKRVMEMRGRGKFTGSMGTNLSSGVQAAVAALKDDTITARTVVVISDGCDATAHSDIAAWESFVRHDAHKLQECQIPVHCFALSGTADHELLSAICRRTDGCFSSFRDAGTDEAVAALRRFLVTCTSAVKGQLSSGVTLSVSCAKDIVIANLTRTGSIAIDNDTLRSCPTTASICFPPLAAGNTSHALITFAVPIDICRQDMPTLGEVRVSFRLANGHAVSFSKILVNESWSRIVDPEIHHWLSQLVVDQRKGHVSLRSPGESHLNAKGGEMVCTQDSVQTFASSSVSLTSVEGIRVELDQETDCTFDLIDTSRIRMTVKEGTINVVTTNDCEVQCVIGVYAIDIRADTAIRLSLTDGVLRACCIVGHCLITTDGKSLKLDSPKQTSARSPQAPVQPWAVTEDVFQDWICMGNTTTQRLLETIAIQTQVCRLHASSVVTQVARYLTRALRLGTLKQTKALVRCRIIYVTHLLNNAKLLIMNNIAYAANNTLLDAVRHELEGIIVVAKPSHRYGLNWEEVLRCNETASALRTERSQGLCSLYELPSFKVQIQALMNERERLVMLAELARQEEVRQSLDQETRRRREVVAALFQRWDFDGNNAIGPHEVQTVLYATSSSADKVDVVIGRWSLFTGAVGNDKCYTADQLVAILLFASEPLAAFEFNTVMDAIEEAVVNTSTLIDESRLTRVAYCIFTVMDDEKLGVVRWKNLVYTLHQCFGDNVSTFRRIEKLTAKAIEVLKELDCHSLTGGEELSSGNIEQVPITAIVFIKAILSFMDTESAQEDVMHRQFKVLFRYLKQTIKYPENIQYVMLRERKFKEKKHLEEWDMRHIFNGITRRELAKVLDPSWTPPSYIQDISHPFTLLLGLSRASTNIDHLHFGMAEDHWSHVKILLRRDSGGFFKFLQNFPVLSISHKQAQRVSKTLETPDLDASNLLKISPVISALVNWLRLVLRIAFLEHDFEVPAPVEAIVVSQAIAEHNDLHQLTQVAPLDTLVAPPPTTNMQSMGHRFSHFFNKVYDPAPKIGYGDLSRFVAASPSNTQSLVVHRNRKGVEASESRTPRPVVPSPILPSRPSTAGTNTKRNFQFKGARPTSASSRRSVGTPF